MSVGTNTNDSFVIGTESSDIYTHIKSKKQIILETNDLRVDSGITTNSDNHWRFGTASLGGVASPALYTPFDSSGFLGIANNKLRGIYSTEVNTQYLVVASPSARGVLAQLDSSSDSTSPFWRSWGIYDRTYSQSSNVYITSNGVLGRSTSARKYKTDIQSANSIIQNAKKILDINSVTWLDKEQVKRGITDYRNFGMIADDFHNAGLTEVVEYGSDGQVEGLFYDRIPAIHNVILSEHEQEIQKLKQENLRLSGEIGILNARLEKLVS